MYLIDTNIFLEILLNQEKQEICSQFLINNVNNLNISDFSFHSIGVILFRYKKQNIYQKFINDVIPTIRLLTLPLYQYKKMKEINIKLNLDFDDAYQYNISKYFGLDIVTLDKDFQNINNIKVLFL